MLCLAESSAALIMDLRERIKSVLRVCLELPDDLTDEELEREAVVLATFARNGFDRSKLKFQIAQMQANRMRMPVLDVEACDKAAQAILELVNTPR
jgi:hypothetical protein